MSISGLKERLRKGNLKIGRFRLNWTARAENAQSSAVVAFPIATEPYKVHLGPGHEWIKPDAMWKALDIDPIRSDYPIDFNNFDRFPFADGTVQCIYGSHVFEHMSLCAAPQVFSECYRILKPGGYFRLVLPDVRKSIDEYLKGNRDFVLFRRRIERAESARGLEYTLFECLREDFLSPTGQPGLLGQRALAHQNAWDFESIVADLVRAGFDPGDVTRKSFQQSECPDFAFEGTYPSEANEDYRSLYVETRKK